MSHFARLQLVGRITYYLGWIALVIGGVVHVHVAERLFLSIGLSQRNFFELSVISFLICCASELRVIADSEKEVAQPVVRQVAA
jgi:hypothetical protein